MGEIQEAVLADAAEMLEIYAPYIRETTVTFEYEVPEVEEFARRVQKVQEKYPWLVYRREGEILGYAYASDYHERRAYAWDCELSVYVRQDARGQGVGRKLYERLLEILEELGYANAYALISVPNEDSEGLHRALGFEEEGRFLRTGYKLGQWLDVAVLTKRFWPPEKRPEAFPRAYAGQQNHKEAK